MLRIDDATAAAALPTPEALGTEGYFTEGNPGGGVPATILRASWLNRVQELLRSVVAGAGITPTKTDYGLLMQAIRRAAGANVSALTANATLTADQAGLVAVSAAASAVTLTLPAANAAGGLPMAFEIARTDTSANTLTVQRAGADTIEGTTSFAIPVSGRLRLRSNGVNSWSVVAEAAIGRSLASTGWMRLPGGLIVQWGTATTGGGGSVTVTLPVTFPVAAWALVLASNVTAAEFHTWQSLTASGFFMQSWSSSTGAAAASKTATWLALGN
jgi:hypothetical protein